MPDSFSEFKIEKKDLAIIGIIMVIYFVQKLFMYRLGIYMEECRDANAHLMVSNGMVPYKDIHFWAYGPFAFCIYPLIFKIFGVGLAVFRLSYIIVGAFVAPLVYLLARRLMTPGWAGIAAFLSFVLIDVPYYTYNHIFATVTGLFALLFFIKFMEGRGACHLFFCGIFAGIGVLVKPLTMGFGALFSILLLMLFLKFQKNPICKINSNHLMAVLAGTAAALLPCIVYFAIHGTLYKFLADQIPFGPDRPDAFFNYMGFSFSLEWLQTHLKYLKAALPYKIFTSTPSQWKDIFVGSYYSLLLYSPIIAPLAIFSLYKYALRKYNLISKAALTYLSLFTVFSIFIAGQPLLTFLNMGRSFTMQVPFLLITYFVFLVNNEKLYRQARGYRRCVVAALSVCFIFYLSFLHFLRYPYSRNKTYTHSLGLQRASGIKVTYPEKVLYERLDKFLSGKLQEDEPIAVIGYYPQFAFLLMRENIFGDMEGVWQKFLFLDYCPDWFGPADHESARKSEDYLISRLETRKPKVIISPIISTRKYLPHRFVDYINKRYVLVKTLGPADIDIYTPGTVNVYRLKK